MTGANAGLGLQLSLRIARMGIHVVMACRSYHRAERAREHVLAAVPWARATVLSLDLAEPDSVRAFRTQLERQVGHLDVLIHNAGIFGAASSRNSAGHELHFATNYLGPFALTGTVLPLFRDRRGARIVSVGSLAHRFAKLNLGTIDAPATDYDHWTAYARSKLALTMYTMELNRRLRERRSNIVALCAHPGMAPTDIVSRLPMGNPKGLVGKWFNAAMGRLIPTAAEAIEPIVHAAFAEGVEGGDYYGPGGWLEIAGAPAKARLNARASDERLAEQLWSTSEALAGVRYLGAYTAPEPAERLMGYAAKLGIF